MTTLNAETAATLEQALKLLHQTDQIVKTEIASMRDALNQADKGMRR